MQPLNIQLRFGTGGAQTDIAKQYGLPIDIVKVYTDADWASNLIMIGKASQGEWPRSMEYQFHRQARSRIQWPPASAKSEYIVMAMFTKQGRWIMQVLKDLQYIRKNGDTIQILGDN
jgi:hypothetical protein